MASILQIGAGGVGRVVAHKLALNSKTFTKVILASRDVKKCDDIARSIRDRGLNPPVCERLDADNVEEIKALIAKHKPALVLNVALPYQDLTIMQAALESGVHYLDTANYEHPDEAKFEYKEQWAFHEKFKNANLMALLGSGFDPGVTNVFVAYAKKHFFDEILYLDILDCNAGDHGYPFATNFNPEINLREVSSEGRYYENGSWITTKPLEIRVDWDYPEIGIKPSYLLYHEELESLVKHFPSIKRARFFMTFSDNYISHMNCLKNVGMLGIDPVKHGESEIIPIQFLKTLLPDPASLAGRTKGKTNIGCYISGIKDGREKTIYIYNVCDHEECFREVGAQAISYTTGVPAMIGAKLILEDKWRASGVFNMEQMDPDYFMEELNSQGLPWKIIEK